MAYERSPSHASSSSPLRELNLPTSKESNCTQDFWYHHENELLDAGGPSSVEVQADLSDSPRSVGSASSQLDDFNNESQSPTHNLLADSDGGDLRTMGVANTWTDDDGFGNDSTVPARGGELSCLGLGMTDSRRWNGSPIPATTFDLFDEDRESVCELGDVPDSNSIPGVCGLRNLGNTCFMNAGLQCLINTQPLLKYFKAHSMELGGTNGSSPIHLTAQFAAFLLKMWSGGYSTLRPAEFKHTLSLYHPQFKDYRQHDCQEFLALLLDSLHEHLSHAEQQKIEESRCVSGGGETDALAINGVAAVMTGGTSGSLPECLLINEEPMELYESSRSSQLSSPRSSSDSVETSSSCTTSCGSSSTARAKAAAQSLRSLPIPEEIKQPFYSLSLPASDSSGGAVVTDLLLSLKNSPNSPQKYPLVMERNVLNPSPESGVQPVLEKNFLSEISSMMKESKTANVNISTGSADEPSLANNEIFFDSEKFESDPARPRAAVASTLLRNSTAELSTSCASSILAGKGKVKNTNVLKEAAKRLSTDHPASPSLSSLSVVEPSDPHQSLPSPNNENVSSIRKKARFEDNGVYEDEPTSSGADPLASSPWDSLTALQTAVSALPLKKEDERRSGGNVSCSSSTVPKDSVVTQTFQGQFRSTVVCCTCKHVSITYEPFMYLSVPLPRAMERLVDIVYIPASAEKTISRHQLVLHQYDDMAKVKATLVKFLDTEEGDGQLVLAEVVNHTISRVLEDKVLLRNVAVDGRTLYTFAVPSPAACLTPPGVQEEATPMNEVESTEPSSVERSWKSCAICLEDMEDSKLRKHTSCCCLLCQLCIEESCKHYGNGFDNDRFVCPVCSLIVNPEEEFAPLDKLHQYRPVIRLLNTPVFLRMRVSNVSTGSSSCWTLKSGQGNYRLVGHPRLLQLPHLLSPKGLYDVIQRLYPHVLAFELCFVDVQGMRCPRCTYPIRCNGCRIDPEAAEISLGPGDCIAVQILPPPPVAQVEMETSDCVGTDSVETEEQDGYVSSSSSSTCRRPNEPLTLDDCLRAFSESEMLDEGNPWFCPKCQKSQCASKTLTINEAPPYLIVYLKRFVFHDNSSSKLDNVVKFPLTGLDLRPYIDVSGDDDCSNDYLYDLYGVVCHFGSASSGHYTAYTRHVNSKDWHYYNDETVLSREPQEEDFSHGYVLFYQRRRKQSCQELLDAGEEESSSSVNISEK